MAITGEDINTLLIEFSSNRLHKNFNSIAGKSKHKFWLEAKLCKLSVRLVVNYSCTYSSII